MWPPRCRNSFFSFKLLIVAFKLHFLTLLMLICKLWAWIRYNVNWLLDDGDDDALMKPVFTSCKCDRSSDTSRWRWHEDCGEFCINISHPLLCFNSICPFILNPVLNWPIRDQYLIMWSVTDQSQSSSLCVRTVFQHFNCPITGTKLMWKIAFQRVKPIQYCSCLHWWTFVSGFLSFV